MTSRQQPTRADQARPEVLGSLPRTRPQLPSRHRARQALGAGQAGAATRTGGAAHAGAATRAGGRAQAERSAGTGGAVAAQRAQQAATRKQPTPDLIASAVQLSSELAEIGLGAAARAVRGALARLPRP